MYTLINKAPSLLSWMVGMSVILFFLVCTLALMWWIPESFASPEEKRAQLNGNCADCGVIESTQIVETTNEPGSIGALGGAVLGTAIISSFLSTQDGTGLDKDLATMAGAVGGAFAGNEIEKMVRKSKHYQTTVRFDDGSVRVFDDTIEPQWQTGGRIKVIKGVLHLQS